MAHDVTKDDRILMFPTIATLVECANAINLSFFEGAERIVAPWEHHRTIFAFTATPRPALLSLTAVRYEFDLVRMREVMAFIEKWNSERINPTASQRMTDEGTIALSFAAHLPLGGGASTSQLCDFLYRASEVADMAVTALMETFAEDFAAAGPLAGLEADDLALRAPLHVAEVEGTPGTDMDALTTLNMFLDGTAAPAVFAEPLAEVTPANIARVWADLGIIEVEDHADFIVTGVNNILMAVFVDNGPSLLIRGHWDSHIPLDDRLKFFLIINDWNASHPTTRVLFHEEDSHLQIRVETAIPTTRGLSDEQLSEFLGAATQQILTTIHALALEISGHSPVAWPE